MLKLDVMIYGMFKSKHSKMDQFMILKTKYKLEKAKI